MRAPKLRLIPTSSSRVAVPRVGHGPEGVHEIDYPELLYPRRRVELVSQGIDAALQGLAGDPYNGTTSVGLRVPAFVTHTAVNRYMFLLCTFNLSEGINGWVRGFRQGWSLGQRLQITQGPNQGPRVVEQWVTTPNFKLPDGNISWHMRLMGKDDPFGRPPNPGEVFDPATGPQQNLAFRDSKGPALLFNTVASGTPFYEQLTAYTPPLAGKPPGEPLTGELDTFYDLKTHWDDAHDWHALDIRIQGPCRVAFYASVQQTDPATRTPLPVPAPFFDGGLEPEEQFLLNFPGASIWRVAGAFVVEIDDHGE
jgi:hypothetical protein